MEQAFTKIVEHVFNNWTALQLAVEHSMGGPNSKQIAIYTVDYIAKYLTSEPDLEVEDIEDVLEDIMDQDFCTVCEDNSIKEVAALLYKFLKLLHQGNIAQCEIEYNNLPVRKQWLTPSQPEQTNPEPNMSSEASTSNSTEVNDTPMEEVDSEWTQVKSRKKR